jgi:hypothetical protein
MKCRCLHFSHLRGETGDRIHAVLCAAGYNVRWLLRMILKKGIGPFCASFFRSSFRSYRQSVRVDRGWSMPQGADFGLLRPENRNFGGGELKKSLESKFK